MNELILLKNQYEKSGSTTILFKPSSYCFCKCFTEKFTLNKNTFYTICIMLSNLNSITINYRIFIRTLNHSRNLGVMFAAKKVICINYTKNNAPIIKLVKLQCSDYESLAKSLMLKNWITRLLCFKNEIFIIEAFWSLMVIILEC